MIVLFLHDSLRISAEVLRKNVGELFEIVGVLRLRTRHDAELHAADFFGEDMALIGGLVELVEDISGYGAGKRGVRVEDLEHLCGGDSAFVLAPRIVVGRGCDQGIAVATISPAVSEW